MEKMVKWFPRSTTLEDIADDAVAQLMVRAGTDDEQAEEAFRAMVIDDLKPTLAGVDVPDGGVPSNIAVQLAQCGLVFWCDHTDYFVDLLAKAAPPIFVPRSKIIRPDQH